MQKKDQEKGFFEINYHSRRFAWGTGLEFKKESKAVRTGHNQSKNASKAEKRERRGEKAKKRTSCALTREQHNNKMNRYVI
ncbi:MAG TPA: hypothetical protein PLN69_11155 [bacterium]|nr:hypothetical protein [bacterium]